MARTCVNVSGSRYKSRERGTHKGEGDDGFESGCHGAGFGMAVAVGGTGAAGESADCLLGSKIVRNGLFSLLDSEKLC